LLKASRREQGASKTKTEKEKEEEEKEEEITVALHAPWPDCVHLWRWTGLPCCAVPRRDREMQPLKHMTVLPMRLDLDLDLDLAAYQAMGGVNMV